MHKRLVFSQDRIQFSLQIWLSDSINWSQVSFFLPPSKLFTLRRTLVKIQLLSISLKIIWGNFMIALVVTHFKIFLNSYLQVLWSQNQTKSVPDWIGSAECFTVSFRKTSQYNTSLNFTAISQPFKSRWNCTGTSFECLFNVSCLRKLKNSR